MPALEFRPEHFRAQHAPHLMRGWRPVRARQPRQNKGLGRERFGLGVLLVEERHRLELVVAGPAVPQIRGAVRTALNPFGGGDRLAALSARISLGQVGEIESGHGAFPFCLLLLLVDGEWDSIAAGYERSVRILYNSTAAICHWYDGVVASEATKQANVRHSGMVRQHRTSDVRLHSGQSGDSGFDAEPVIGPRFARTRWHRPGMTVRDGLYPRFPAPASENRPAP